MSDLVLCSVETCLRRPNYAGMCQGHYRRWRRHGDVDAYTPLLELVDTECAFFRKVRQEGDCWIWTGAQQRGGYGYFRVGRKNVAPHRWAYTFMRAEIPDGLHIDHLCRTPLCVNPWHLEPVTQAENNRRGTSGAALRARADARTHCGKGHEWTPENTRVRTRGRECRACANAAARARRVARGAIS